MFHANGDTFLPHLNGGEVAETLPDQMAQRCARLLQAELSCNVDLGPDFSLLLGVPKFALWKQRGPGLTKTPRMADAFTGGRNLFPPVAAHCYPA